MINGLKPYPATKDSGSPWLGQVPEHWDAASLGRVGKFFKGNGGSKADEVSSGVPCVRYGDLYTRHEFFIRQSYSFITDERSAHYTPIQYGDVLFAASGETIDDIGRSAASLLKGSAYCGGDVIVFRSDREMVPKFHGYVCDAPSSKWQKARMGRGFTVVHIYASALKTLVIAIPPIAEQHAIVRFLDHADARIRRYIAAKRKLIKLLEEEKQAIIHCAVTRGLDPHVRLKPSGVAWLGEVPEHWEVGRVGRLFVQRNEVGFGTLPILEVSLRTGVRVRAFGESDRKQIMSDREKYKRACKGDIAYNMMRMWQGAVGIAPCDGLISPAYVVARPVAGTISEFFSALFRTTDFMREVDRNSRGIVKDRNRLYWEDFKRIVVAYPAPDEQSAIVAGIRERTELLDKSIKLTERELELIRELRTRLISDVVTGNLDVRAAATDLPDMSVEAPAVDEADEVLQDDLTTEELDLESEAEAEAA